MAAVAIALCSILAFLYSRTQEGDKSAYFDNVVLLQHLKQQDAEWGLDVLKSKVGLDRNYDALATARTDLNTLLEQFKTSVAAQQHDSLSDLAPSSQALGQAIEQKAALIEHFKSHQAVLRNSVYFLSTAAEDAQHSLHTAKSNTTLPLLSHNVNELLLGTLIYGRAATIDRSASLLLELNTLLQNSSGKVSPQTAERLAIFAAHVRMILREVPEVNVLLDQISAVPTTMCFDTIDRALSSEQQRAAARAQQYRRYLLIFAMGLISLLLYAAVRLIRSHAMINRVNEDFRQANESLEQRVQERTQELANSLSLLNATLDSTADGIIAVGNGGEIVCCNGQFLAMWGLSAEWFQTVQGKSNSIVFTASMVKNSEHYLQRIADSRANPELETFDVLELKDGRIFERYIKPQKVKGCVVGRVINFRDITERRRAEQEFEKVHQQLLDASRRAGMAEVATNVLHNVGNVLNSVNVSASLVTENMKCSKVASLAKVSGLLHEHAQDLAAFINHDAKGKHLPKFLARLCEQLLSEQQASIKELDLLRNNIDHIKEIVAMQQSHSKVSGVKEIINVAALIEDALRMNSGALQRHGVKIIREFEAVPPLNTEKHKILQILVNLVRNAKYACSDSGLADKRVTLRVSHSDGRIKIAVIDNGVGISAENLTRIFFHGFTTRKDGHGFGLHSGALAARELGGSLQVHSDGAGMGATFTLELPLDVAEIEHV
jgi:PAS domain S-box-containing protein